MRQIIVEVMEIPELPEGYRFTISINHKQYKCVVTGQTLGEAFKELGRSMTVLEDYLKHSLTTPPGNAK